MQERMEEGQEPEETLINFVIYTNQD
jgi:hypothetical protein